MEHSLLPTYDQEWTYAAHRTMRSATAHKEKVGFYRRLLPVGKITCVQHTAPNSHTLQPHKSTSRDV